MERKERERRGRREGKSEETGWRKEEQEKAKINFVCGIRYN